MLILWAALMFLVMLILLGSLWLVVHFARKKEIAAATKKYGHPLPNPAVVVEGFTR